MDYVIRLSREKVKKTQTSFQRFLIDKIDWSWRLNAILGARGAGKTTLLLQQMKKTHAKGDTAVYASLDDYYFTENRLYQFVDDMRAKGYTHFFLDEVHKYQGWARELKNIYDSIPDVNITFTGSSILEILKQEVDLSRRSVGYYLPELSFREFLKLAHDIHFESHSLEDIVNNSWQIASDIVQEIKPLVHFQEYLAFGAYPYYLENKNLYHERLQKTIRLIIESDLQFIEGYNPQNANKINKLLYILANNVPFKPNITKLSERIGTTRNTVIQYLNYLEKASIIHSLHPQGSSVSTLQKPEKTLLRNPNLAYAISPEFVNTGSLRESFFVSQLSVGHSVETHSSADFTIDNKYVFEVGGKNKSSKQIKGLPSSYLAIDDVENAVGNSIPLWLFGLLY